MSLWNQKINPMLAHLSQPFDSDEWLNEIKYDGTRCIAFIDARKKSVILQNRRLLEIQYRYPELQELWKDVNAKRVILDAEIVLFKKGKPDFYSLAEREHVESKTRIELLSKMMPSTFVVFDILHLDGNDIIDKPLIERKKILEKVVKESNRLLLSRYVIGNGKKFFKEVKKRGLEGIMAKKLDSVYTPGVRSKLWLKIKAFKTLDCIIAGYTTGTGKREELLGSLIAGCYHEGKLRYVGKIGTGFSEEELKELLEKLRKIRTDKCPFDEEPELKLLPERRPVWIKPKYICEVRFMNLSKDEIMRAPAFIRLRNDKRLKECILEI